MRRQTSIESSWGNTEGSTLEEASTHVATSNESESTRAGIVASSSKSSLIKSSTVTPPLDDGISETYREVYKRKYKRIHKEKYCNRRRDYYNSNGNRVFITIQEKVCINLGCQHFNANDHKKITDHNQRIHFREMIDLKNIFWVDGIQENK